MSAKRRARHRQLLRVHFGGEASLHLRRFFERNGYVRRQLARRLETEGNRLYKKGDEVRLVASSPAELAEIRRLLVEAGFRPGRPFTKGNQFRQPLYGREAVARFLAMVGRRKAARARGPHG